MLLHQDLRFLVPRPRGLSPCGAFLRRAENPPSRPCPVQSTCRAPVGSTDGHPATPHHDWDLSIHGSGMEAPGIDKREGSHPHFGPVRHPRAGLGFRPITRPPHPSRGPPLRSASSGPRAAASAAHPRLDRPDRIGDADRLATLGGCSERLADQGRPVELAHASFPFMIASSRSRDSLGVIAPVQVARDFGVSPKLSK